MRTALVVVVALWFVFVVLAFWRRHVRFQEERQQEEQLLRELIRPPVQRDEFKKADERLPVQAARRREIAEAKRLEAAQIESGQPVDERIKLVVHR